jgi:hypothetical protein
VSSKFQDAMRRVITGDNAQGQSIIIIDGGPSSEKGSPDRGEMFEIWEDTRRSSNKRCLPDLNQILKLACLAIPSVRVAGAKNKALSRDIQQARGGEKPQRLDGCSL